MKILYILIPYLFLLLFSGCESTTFSTTQDDSSPPIIVLPSDDDEEEEDEEENIYIIDRTGKQWDITHAVKVYNFVPEDFQFGLGPFAITPIINPEMLSPGDPGFPAPDATRVIGTTINGDIRAYPLETLVFHEIVDENFEDIHVAVAFWPLVNLTAVYSREIDERILTLSASGWTYDFTFVLYDYETESLWYHLPGDEGLTCISGFYADRKLKEFDSMQIRWSDWVTFYPNSKFLNYTYSGK